MARGEGFLIWFTRPSLVLLSERIADWLMSASPLALSFVHDQPCLLRFRAVLPHCPIPIYIVLGRPLSSQVFTVANMGQSVCVCVYL